MKETTDQSVKNDEEVKPFSEHIIKKDEAKVGGDAGNYNDGKVDIDSDASDQDAYMSALLQNTALALVDPYLARDGTYPIMRYPRELDKEALWKIIFSKEDGNWTYAYWCHPTLHDMFMEEVKRKKENYAYTLEQGKEYLGSSCSMPPYIAKVVELDIGHEYGTEEFMKYVANHEELKFFIIDEKAFSGLKK